MTDRAVSDTVGFVLVFSLMIASVSVVTVVGMDGLRDVRDAERVNNAERAFDVLANNVEDVHRRGAPSRATEIKLADARLGPGERTTVRVWTGARNNDTVYGGAAFSPIVYTAGDTRLTFEQTAVIREDPSGAAVVRPPTMLLDEDRTAIVVVRTTTADERTVSGSGVVLLRTVGERSSVETVTSDPADVTVEIESTRKRAPAWERALEAEIESEADACRVLDSSPDTVRCGYSTEALVVTTVTISYELE